MRIMMMKNLKRTIKKIEHISITLRAMIFKNWFRSWTQAMKDKMMDRLKTNLLNRLLLYPCKKILNSLFYKALSRLFTQLLTRNSTRIKCTYRTVSLNKKLDNKQGLLGTLLNLQNKLTLKIQSHLHMERLPQFRCIKYQIE